LDLNLLFQTLLSTVSEQAKSIERINAKFDVQENMIVELKVENKLLKLEIAELKNKKNSNNSHIPPSQDQNRPKTNQSLRVSSGKKVGASRVMKVPLFNAALKLMKSSSIFLLIVAIVAMI